MKWIKTLSILAIVIILLLFVGSFCLWGKKEVSRFVVSYLDIFDTQTEIIGYGTSREEFEIQATQLKEKLTEYHKLYDIYNEYEGIQNIKTINDQAGIAPVKVDREIIELLKFGKEMYERTDGQVNVAMGSVLSIWHEYRAEAEVNPNHAELPAMDDLRNAAMHTDINKMIIDEENATVYLEDPQMSLDVGSVGKGYAVQKTAEYAKELGIESILLSVGGNICAVGTRANGTGWRIGIQNPDLESQESYVEKLEISDFSLVTSGSYQRYYEVNGTQYCHIIDPDTLMPGEYFDSVSILAKDSGMADVLSTALFNMSLEEGRAFIDGMDGAEAMWILKDGSIVYSGQFQQYVIQ